MDDVAFISTFYGFGILGLFGITLLPLRAVWLLWQNSNLLRSGRSGKLIFAVVVLAAAFTLIYTSVCVFHVARCLIGYWCTADRSGGWLWLAGVGFWYASFEVFAFVSFFAARKLLREAT